MDNHNHYLSGNFDQIADTELRRLDKYLSSYDPDEIESELASDVLTITVNKKNIIIINRHRAAQQIWMAAERQAWHFHWDSKGLYWQDQSARVLHIELSKVLSKLCNKSITIPAHHE